MGFTKEVFKAIQGFSSIRFGEDIDLSIRIKKAGFSSSLILDAYVYHQRRTDFRKFYKQVFNSGIARINLFKRHPQSLKLVHFLPAFFVLFIIASFLLSGVYREPLLLLPLSFLILLIFFVALFSHKNLKLAWLSLIASFVQLIGYGSGSLLGFWNRIIMGKGEFEAFKKNFYK